MILKVRTPDNQSDGPTDLWPDCKLTRNLNAGAVAPELKIHGYHTLQFYCGLTVASADCSTKVDQAVQHLGHNSKILGYLLS